jgi:hypothetical protein
VVVPGVGVGVGVGVKGAGVGVGAPASTGVKVGVGVKGGVGVKVQVATGVSFAKRGVSVRAGVGLAGAAPFGRVRKTKPIPHNPIIRMATSPIASRLKILSGPWPRENFGSLADISPSF